MADFAHDVEARRRLRRVPEQLRKRSAQSCDLCRKRRCRCMPGSSARACAACEKHNVECSYTLPRKHRIYGNVDDLSERCKCLEAIVRGAFPGEPLDTVADIRKIGHRMGYPIPEPPLGSEQGANVSEIVKSYGNPEAPARPFQFERIEPLSRRNSCPNIGSGRLPNGIEDGTPPKDAESLGLIRDPTGRQHYIGPSGSLQFLSQLRRLLLSRNQQNLASVGDSPNATRFTEDDAAQALEADSIPVNTEDPSADPAGESSGDNEQSPSSISSSLARDFTRQPWDAAGELFRKLPPRHTTDLLLQSYFKVAHEDFPLFHRGTFEEEYESYWALSKQCSPTAEPSQASPMEWGWIATLQMMIVFGSMCEPTIPVVDHAMLRSQCVVITRTLLPQLVSKCSLSNVRALLLLSLFLHNNNERNAAWNLVGTATRISFALGLHRRDVAAYFRPIEREVRKRVFCTLYSFEQFLASSLGRPSGLNDFDVEIALPREGVLGTGTDKVVALSIKLQNILGKARISQAVRSLSSRNSDTTGHEASAKETMGLLKSWRGELAACQSLNIPSIAEPDDSFKEDNPPTVMTFNEIKLLLSWQDRTRLRAALVLHMQYRYIAIMVARPFLLRDAAMVRDGRKEKRFNGSESSLTSQLAATCVQNACQLARILLLLDEFGLVNGVCAMDVFYAYSASLVLILQSICEGPISANSVEVRRETELRQLIKSLRAVVTKVSKSGTMKRFARVMATFEDSVFNNNCGENSTKLPQGTPAPRRESGQQYNYVGIDMSPAGRSADTGLFALQAPPMPGVFGTAFLGMDAWPHSDLGTFYDGREFSGLIASLLQPSDATMVVDFEEVDSVLRNIPM